MTEDLLEIFRILMEAYGPQGWWPAETPEEMAIGAILTQNTSWRNVERALENLRAAGLLDLERLSLAEEDLVAELVRPAGFFRQKASYLKALARECSELGGLEALLSMPTAEAREKLLKIRGIGLETADSILLYAGGHPIFVVDSYTVRLLSRLGWKVSPTARYEDLRLEIEGKLPRDVRIYQELHALVVVHCKSACRKRPLCDLCGPLAIGLDCEEGKKSRERAP